MVTKAPKSLPLPPQKLCSQASPGERSLCKHAQEGRRACYIGENVKNKLKSTAVSCGGLHRPEVSARRGCAGGSQLRVISSLLRAATGVGLIPLPSPRLLWDGACGLSRFLLSP